MKDLSKDLFNPIANEDFVQLFDKDYGIFSEAYATGVKSITSAKKVYEDNKVYNLAGQQVGAGYHGIVIQNGVKKIQ